MAAARFANNLIFLGAPGVGKGTFASKIAPLLGVPAISTGDIIRAEIKGGTELGKKCQAYTNSGQLVPDEVVSSLVRKRLQEADAQKGWILVSEGQEEEGWCLSGACHFTRPSSSLLVACLTSLSLTHSSLAGWLPSHSSAGQGPGCLSGEHSPASFCKRVGCSL